MFQIGIYDDEPAFLEHSVKMINEILSAHGIPCCTHTFQDSHELSIFLSANESCYSQPKYIDLLLLNVLPKKENGIQLAKSIRQSGSQIPIIFISDTADFVFDCYEAEPLDYLLKPLDPDKLTNALLRAYQKYRQKNFLIHTVAQTIILRLDEVLYMEINNKTLSIYLSDGKVLKTTTNLRTLLQKLPSEQFVQCHRSYVVSLSAISSICRYTIELKNQERIPVSKKRYKDIQNALLVWAAFLE